MRRVWLGVVLVLAVLAGCHDPVAPRPNLPTAPLVGTYDLLAIDGATLPVYSDTHDSSYTEMYGGYLELAGGDSLWYHAERYWVAVTGHIATFHTDVAAGRWTTTADGVTLAGFVPNSPITISAATVRIEAQVGAQRYSYARPTP